MKNFHHPPKRRKTTLMTCYHNHFEKRKTENKKNTVIQWPTILQNERQPFELLSFHLQGTAILSISLQRTTSAPLDIHCHPANRCRSPAPKKLGGFFSATWNMGSKQLPLTLKMFGLLNCSKVDNNLNKTFKNPAKFHSFLVKIVFFLHINKTYLSKSPLVSSKGKNKCISSKRNSVSSALQIVGAWAPFGSSCDSFCWLYK